MGRRVAHADLRIPQLTDLIGGQCGLCKMDINAAGATWQQLLNTTPIGRVETKCWS